MKSRRILITGLSSHVGGRLAQALEREPGVEALIGVDSEDPRHELERTEFVRLGMEAGQLSRILRAAAIDTVLDSRLITDGLLASPAQTHAVNVTGTASLVAACAERDSPVRRLIFKSSSHYYGLGPGDPAFFTEDMPRARPPRTALERDVVAAETAVLELAAARRGRSVTVVRCAEEIGGDDRASHVAMLSLPVVPLILGFDPRFQFIHSEDVVGALVHAVRHELPGVYNAAADGVLALTEAASLLGKPALPLLPPWGAGFAALQLRRLGLRIPVELLRQLRFGRGLDNRRLKAAGYQYRYTSREAVLKLRAQQRLRPLLRSGVEAYRYAEDVEAFLRWSASVRPPAPGPAEPGEGPPLRDYDSLGTTELIEVIGSLEPEALATLRSYEAAHQARSAVLEALDRTLARRRA